MRAGRRSPTCSTSSKRSVTPSCPPAGEALSSGREPWQREGPAAIVGLVSWQLTRQPGPTTSPGNSTPVQRSLTRLTFDQGLQTDPAFSPDGRFIAYASDKSGNFDIWVQQLSGGDAVQVTKSAAADTQPAWSPDGSTIAFRSERDGGGIYVVPAVEGRTSS